MIDQLTMEDFKPHVGQVFHVIVDDQWEMITRLSAVFPWGGQAAEGLSRTPFMLVFHAAENAIIPQRIYRVKNAHMAPMDLFVVPVGPDEHGMRYEVTFA